MKQRDRSSILIFLSTANTIIFIAVLMFNTVAIQRLIRDYLSLQQSGQILHSLENVFGIVRHFGFERGRVNVIMNFQGDSEKMSKFRDFVASHRQGGKDSLNQLIAELETGSVRMDQSTYQQILRAKEDTREFRHAYLEQFSRPFLQRDLTLDDRWFEHMSAQIQLLNQLAFSIKELQTIHVALNDQVELILLLSNLRDYAGPVVSYLKAATFNRDSLSEARKQDIIFRRMIVKSLVTELKIRGQKSLPPEILRTIDEFDDFYQNRVLEMAKVIQQDQSTSFKQPVDYRSYHKNGVKALEQLNQISNAIFALGNTRLEAEKRAAIVRIGSAVIVSLFIFIVVFVNLALIYKRIYRRILRTAQIMNQLSESRTDIEIPSRVHNDEIGDLETGLERFHQNLINLKKSHHQLEILSTQDSMTHLLNHEKIIERLEFYHAESTRFGHPYSVLMIDIDHFKRVNDQHGHQAGDKVIKQLSRILTASIRRTDAVGRYGGEEFLIVLSHTPIAPAQIFAETLRRTIEQQDFKLPYFSVTVSIGIAMLEQDQSPNQVIEQADQQLYLAKQSGRNCVRPAVNSQ